MGDGVGPRRQAEEAVITAGVGAGGEDDVPADVSGQYVVVWFTQLSTDGDGKRRAWLNEVIVTG